MKTFSITDKGKTRKMNQDYLFASETPVGILPNLFIVADGMGGHNAGDYASRYAVEVMVSSIKAAGPTETAVLLEQVVEEANRKLLYKSLEDSRLAGMGTTAVMATIEGRHLTVANVGDSRLYVVNSEITQITRDHSLVEKMVRNGQLTEEEARVHPDRNIITRAIGATADVMTDIFEMDIEEDDSILLCSDGLTNMLTDSRIWEILRSLEEMEVKVRKLVECANENGGQDNITAILIEPCKGEVTTC